MRRVTKTSLKITKVVCERRSRAEGTKETTDLGTTVWVLSHECKSFVSSQLSCVEPRSNRNGDSMGGLRGAGYPTPEMTCLRIETTTGFPYS